MAHRWLRPAAAAALLAVLGLACGQKPGVHVETIAGAGPAVGRTEVNGGVTEAQTPAEVPGGVPGEVGGSASGGARTGGGTARGGGGSLGGSRAGPTGQLPAGGDATGVTATEIRVGIHAPVTGAAPFPAEAFAKGQDIYWTWKGAPKVFGRTVKLFFEDDQYNPTTAVDRCRKLAEQDKVFLLVGGGGTDQIQACARYAASKGVPYLSAGVTEIGLRNLKTYFALSMSYAQQAPLLWQMIQKDPRLSPYVDKVAMVRTDTPNFEDAHDAFVRAMSPKTLVLDRKLAKNPSQTEFQQLALALQQADAQVIFILVAPVHYIQLTARLAANYRPWWVGVGITMGLNEVLDTGCQTSANAIEKGLFFSPFPGIDVIDSLDPNYNAAYQEKNGTRGDDLGIALWGLNKTLHRLFEATGPALTRQAFIAATERAQVTTNVFPALSFTPQNHFGASQVHVLKADCSSRTYKTEKQFVSQF